MRKLDNAKFSPINIQDQFNLIAKEYDENRRKFITCFDDYYVSATDFAAKSLEKSLNSFLTLEAERDFFRRSGILIFLMQIMCFLTLRKKCFLLQKSGLKMFRT